MLATCSAHRLLVRVGVHTMQCVSTASGVGVTRRCWGQLSTYLPRCSSTRSWGWGPPVGVWLASGIHQPFRGGTAVLPASCRELSLAGNEVQVKGAEALAGYIMQFKCLEVLSLSGNAELGAAGIKALATVLSEDAVLTRLDLAGCNVGSEVRAGARCTVEAGWLGTAHGWGCFPLY